MASAERILHSQEGSATGGLQAADWAEGCSYINISMVRNLGQGDWWFDVNDPVQGEGRSQCLLGSFATRAATTSFASTQRGSTFAGEACLGGARLSLSCKSWGLAAPEGAAATFWVLHCFAGAGPPAGDGSRVALDCLRTEEAQAASRRVCGSIRQPAAIGACTASGQAGQLHHQAAS